MVTCYIGLGANIGDRQAYITRALSMLRQEPHISGITVSSIYETDPVSEIPQGKYLNGVVRIVTDLAPEALRIRLAHIEDDLGRTRGPKNGPRTIDLDILYYGDESIKTDTLTIPHPRIREREFVLRGLRELGKSL